MKHIINDSIPKILEITQSTLAGLGFYFAYMHYAQNEYLVALHFLIIFVVIPLTGFTGLASVFFSDVAAKSKGREVGSPYQIQSGINNISVAMTAIIILYFKWGVYAELSVLFVSLIFFSLSSINHAVEFFKQGNKKVIHLMRPIFSLLLVLASLPIIIRVL